MKNGYRIRELKIELTRNCPLRCLHCSSNGWPNAPERLHLGRVSDLLQEFAALGGETLAFSGGEPLRYEGLHAVLDTGRRLGLNLELYSTGIVSNGHSPQSVSPDQLAFIKASGAKVIFSVHGACSATHDAITQVEGSFLATILAIERTLSAGIRADVHFVPMAPNVGEVPETIRLLATSGIRKVSWLRFVPQGRGKTNRHRLSLNARQLRSLVHVRTRLQETCPTVEIRTGSPFNILCPDCPVPCVAGVNQLVIRPDGRALPCDAFKQFETPDKFGNIMSHSLTEVWEMSSLLNEVRRVLQVGATSACASCEFYERCSAGCLAQKAIAAGRIRDGRDPECLMSCVKVESGCIEGISIQ